MAFGRKIKGFWNPEQKKKEDNIQEFFQKIKQKEIESKEELIDNAVEETKRKNKERKTSEEFINELKKKDEQKENKQEKKEPTDNEESYYDSLFKE